MNPKNIKIDKTIHFFTATQHKLHLKLMYTGIGSIVTYYCDVVSDGASSRTLVAGRNGAGGATRSPRHQREAELTHSDGTHGEAWGQCRARGHLAQARTNRECAVISNHTFGSRRSRRSCAVGLVRRANARHGPRSGDSGCGLAAHS